MSSSGYSVEQEPDDPNVSKGWDDDKKKPWEEDRIMQEEDDPEKRDEWEKDKNPPKNV